MVVVLIQANEEIESSIADMFFDKGMVVHRPETVKHALELLEFANVLVINPKGMGMVAVYIISRYLEAGKRVVQCIPDGDPLTEKEISLSK